MPDIFFKKRQIVPKDLRGIAISQRLDDRFFVLRWNYAFFKYDSRMIFRPSFLRSYVKFVEILNNFIITLREFSQKIDKISLESLSKF